MATYSFLDVNAAITGPGGAFSLGSGSGAAKEGIDVEQVDELDTLTVGADGAYMHSLHAGRAGKVVIRLLKTSPTNALLSALAAFQRTSGANHGRNTITIANAQTGDVITCQGAAFAKIPKITFAEEGGTNEWEFLAGRTDVLLGSGA